MSGRSIGMIETWGYVAAVEALDAGMKAANVLSEGCEVTPSALVTVSFTGDVSAVKTAVAAGIAAARKVGQVVAHQVIPRPDPQLRLELPVSNRPVESVPAKKRNAEQAPSGPSSPKKKKATPAGEPAVEVALPKATVSKAARGKKPKVKAVPPKKRGRSPATKPVSPPKKTARRMPKKKPPGGDKKAGA